MLDLRFLYEQSWLSKLKLENPVLCSALSVAWKTVNMPAMQGACVQDTFVSAMGHL